MESVIADAGLPSATPNTITRRETLISVLETVRGQGYAIDLEEQEEGVCCLAAPVFTPDGKIFAAMSISGPASRLSRGRLNDLIPNVKGVAAALTKTIGSTETM